MFQMLRRTPGLAALAALLCTSSSVFASLNSFTDYQVQGWNTAFIQNLSPSNLAEMSTNDQIQALTLAQLSDLSGAAYAAQMQAIDMTDFNYADADGMCTGTDSASSSGCTGGAGTCACQLYVTDGLYYSAADVALSTYTNPMTSVQTVQTWNQIAALSTTQIGQLTTTQMAAMTALQAAELLQAQIAALSQIQIEALSSTAIGGLTATQMGYFVAANVIYITPYQMSQLTSTQLNGIATALVFPAITASQIQAVSPANIALLPNAKLNALSATAMGALTIAQVQALTSTAITGQIVNLGSTQFGNLTTKQIQALITGSGNQVRALSAVQLAYAIDDAASVLAALTIPQIQDLQSSVIQALSSTLVNTLSLQQIQAL